MMYYLIRWLFALPFVILFRPKIHGFKKLFFKGPAIIVSNHWSAADPVFLSFVFPRPIHFLAKSELFATPLSKWFMTSILTYPIEEGQANITSLKQTIQKLQSGKVAGIFPEGHRSVNGDIDALQTGTAFLAIRSGVPVIPVYSDPNTLRHMRVHMTIGDPIDCKAAAARYGGKPVQGASQAIRDALVELKLRQEGICI